jgi:2-amino-4-hydroxy-6-hydroxymethyldihydropteridine diphosphokinase
MVRVGCAIALGSNLGDSSQILTGAIATLQQQPQIDVQRVSHWYLTAPVGGPPQPDYWNGCAIIVTSYRPLELLAQLLWIEQQFGRVRRERWGPRSLDLDLIFYGEEIWTSAELHVPHPRMRDRAFVLLPLAEIAPHWRDPVTQQTVAALCAAVDTQGVKRIEPACHCRKEARSR